MPHNCRCSTRACLQNRTVLVEGALDAVGVPGHPGREPVGAQFGDDGPTPSSGAMSRTTHQAGASSSVRP